MLACELMNRVREHFTVTVDDYDTVANAVVMCNDQLHERMIDALPFSREQSITGVDIGCGTGHGMALFLDRFPRSSVVGVDFSPRMLKKCEARLKRYGQRVSLVPHDIRGTGTDSDFEGKFDCVMSAMTIHNLDQAGKADTFDWVSRALRPSGTFVNADFIAFEDEFLNRETARVYRNYVRGNLSREELKIWEDHIDQDQPQTLSQQRKLLLDAGLSDLTLHWLHVNETVYSAQNVRRLP